MEPERPEQQADEAPNKPSAAAPDRFAECAKGGSQKYRDNERYDEP
jgi:hypothetical protein